MSEEEIFAKIIEAVDPLEEVSLETNIKSCADFSSLGLFNILVTFKPMGVKLYMRDLLNVVTVGDLVKLIASRAA